MSDPYDNARVIRRVIFTFYFRNNFSMIFQREDKLPLDQDLQLKNSFLQLKINSIKLIFLKKRKNKQILKFNNMIQALDLLEIILMMGCFLIQNMFHNKLITKIQKKLKSQCLKIRAKRRSLLD